MGQIVWTNVQIALLNMTVMSVIAGILCQHWTMTPSVHVSYCQCSVVWSMLFVCGVVFVMWCVVWCVWDVVCVGVVCGVWCVWCVVCVGCGVCGVVRIGCGVWCVGCGVCDVLGVVCGMWCVRVGDVVYVGCVGCGCGGCGVGCVYGVRGGSSF